MSSKLLTGFGILVAAGLLVAGCGDEPEDDSGSTGGGRPLAEHQVDWRYSSADAAVRTELAKLEAERNQQREGWPYASADAAERNQQLEDWPYASADAAERNQQLEDWPYTSADAAVRTELAKLEAERAADTADG
jgi:hypothetical protein